MKERKKGRKEESYVCCGVSGYMCLWLLLATSTLFLSLSGGLSGFAKTSKRRVSLHRFAVATTGPASPLLLF